MKKIQLTIEDIFGIPGCEIFNPDNFRPVSSVSIDSRNIPGNCMFVAIKGKKNDAHNFIPAAIKNGARAVVINKNRIKYFLGPEGYEYQDIPFIAVKDTTKALGDIAAIWRQKLNAKVVGITGSTGKTTAKEMLSALLSEKFKVNRTIANNNNHIGVPLTILGTTASHEVLVAELGTNHFGEIDYTSNILMPDYAVITNIGDSHLEYLGSRRGVLKEKLALFEAAALRNGTLFVNNDDKMLKKVLKNYPNKISFGFNNNPDVKGKISSYTEDGRAKLEIKSGKTNIKEEVPIYGEQSAKNILIASAVALNMGISPKELSKGIKKLKAFDKRLSTTRNRNYFIIDDTYNANPESMKAALNLLSKINLHRKKIAILGDMFELGEESVKKHLELVSAIKKNKIDEVYTLGKFSKNIVNKLQGTKIASKHFTSRKNLTSFLSAYNFTDSVILVKGSRGMKMEEFVKLISQK